MLKNYKKHITKLAVVTADLLLFDNCFDPIEHEVREPGYSYAGHPMDVG